MIGVVGGLMVIAGGAPLWSAVLAVLLMAAGLVLAVTDSTGHCLLYRRPGHIPASCEGRNTMTNEERREPHVGGNSDPDYQGAGGHSRHRWMMIACCIPMLVVAVALIASGTVGIGSLVFVLACLGMMAVMMFSMGGQRH